MRVIDLARKLKQVHEIVRKENKKGQEHSRKYYDKRTQLREFEIGDLVYRNIEPRESSLINGKVRMR